MLRTHNVKRAFCAGLNDLVKNQSFTSYGFGTAAKLTSKNQAEVLTERRRIRYWLIVQAHNIENRKASI
jgi:hypothetical protein